MILKRDSLLQGGKYRVVRYIASGGFGCTYEAIHTTFNERVAIKEFFVKDFCSRDENSDNVVLLSETKRELLNRLRTKFRDEAIALHRLNHEGIVRVTDVFEENGTSYYVMDFIEGRPLSDIICDSCLPESIALKYIRQVCGALKYLHEHNCLHLDIKPGNIMIDNHDNAILIDFGTAKQYDECNGENTSTLIGMTAGYAPPEQMSNSVIRFFPATDIYALGATLYKLLTGSMPLNANLRISGEELLPLPDGIGKSTCQAVTKAMALNKYNRPQSIENFLEILDSDVADSSSKSQSRASKVVDEDTILIAHTEQSSQETANIESFPRSTSDSYNLKWFTIILVICTLIVAAVILVILLFFRKDAFTPAPEPVKPKTTQVVMPTSPQVVQPQKEPVVQPQKEPVVQPKVDKPTPESEVVNGITITWDVNITDSQKRVLKELVKNMVDISGGTFEMGALNSNIEAFLWEKPSHNVTLSGYKLNKYELTQKEWQAVMGSNPSAFIGDNNPVERVSWDEIVNQFLPKLNKLTGLSFRLPTEAEWEYAARGGFYQEDYKYSGSNNIDNVAWYNESIGNHSHKVGMKDSNILGLFDMSGNVQEWCNDNYDSYSSAPQINPKGPDSGVFKIVRGGCWRIKATHARVTCRTYGDSSRKKDDIGFRLAL